MPPTSKWQIAITDQSDQSENATCTIDDQYEKFNLSVTQIFKVTPTSPELTSPTPTCGYELCNLQYEEAPNSQTQEIR